MTRFRSCLFTLLLIFGYQQSCLCEEDGSGITKYFGHAGTALKVGAEVYKGVQEIYNMLQPKTTKESESDIKIKPGMEQRVTDQIKHVSKKLDSLKVDMQNMKNEIIDKILSEIPEQMDLKNNLHEIYLRINQIENLYDNFVNYIKSPTNFNKATLVDFATHATSHDLNELPNVLKTIHWMLVQTDVNAGDSVLTILSRSTQTPANMCKRQQSLQQLLHNLYSTIAVADIKGYSMIQFSYGILQKLNGGNVTGEMDLAEEQFTHRITNTLKSVKKAMASASREIWKCNTYGHKEGVTYTKLNNVFQKYIINEADVNSEGTCTLTCPDFKQTKVYGCYNGKICAQQRTCSGELWNCEYKIGSTMWVCPSDRSSSRRYEYIEYGNSQRYGPKGSCKKSSTEMSSWTRGTVKCNYCMCMCDDLGYSESDRYVNLRSAMSRLYDDFAVIGTRFVKDNHILHIQIKEGKVLPGGLIDEKTIRWVPIESYKLNEPMPGSEGTKWEYVPVEDGDYHVLEWKVYRYLHRDDKFLYTKAAINFDDLDFAGNELGNNYVVTGLKFSVNEVHGSGYHLNLEVNMTPFNITTGKLDGLQNVWYSTFKTFGGAQGWVKKSHKTEVNIENLDIPTNSASLAVPTSQSNQFLYFTTSSLETDAGQSTIPFIDLEPVETYPPTPLSGAGIFHKSNQGSGGFLSLKLFTFNYEPYL